MILEQYNIIMQFVCNFKMPNISYSLSCLYTALYNQSQLCTAVQAVQFNTAFLATARFNFSISFSSDSVFKVKGCLFIFMNY